MPSCLSEVCPWPAKAALIGPTFPGEGEYVGSSVDWLGPIAKPDEWQGAYEARGLDEGTSPFPLPTSLTPPIRLSPGNLVLVARTCAFDGVIASKEGGRG